MSKRNKKEEVEITSEAKESGNVKVETKTVIKKRGGVFSFFMGFLFCFILLIVAIGGTFLYCYYNVTLTQIENMLGVKLPIEGEIRDKALKDLIALGLEYKDSITEATLKTVRDDFGVELPESIPGTEIGLTAIYSAQIDFLDESKAVEDYRIQDIVNNLDSFIQAVLPVFYANTTVQQVLNSIQVTLPEDLNYPALTDAYYNVGTSSEPNLKTLGELTIEQALNLLPEHFGSDNMTVQEVVNALGLDILDYEGDTDVYAGLRNLVITKITTDDLLNNADGALLNSLFDLSDYEFTQTDEFNSTKLANMLDYIETVPLGQILEIPELNDGSAAADHLLFAIQNVTVSDLTSENMVDTLTSKINETYPNFVLGSLIDFDEMQNLDFLANVSVTALISDPSTAINDTLQTVEIGNFITLGSLFSEDTTVFNSGALAALGADTYLSDVRSLILSDGTVGRIELGDILTAEQLTNGNLTAYENMTLLEILQENEGLTLGEVLNATTPDLTNTVGAYVAALSGTTASNFESTLSTTALIDLIGAENSPSAVVRLGDLNLREIADSPDLMETLLSNFGTLGDLIGSADGILGIIGDVSIEDLLGDDPAGAIMDALKSSDQTLGSMLGSTQSDNELINSIMNIKVGDLFGDVDLSTVIKNALTANGNTLGSLLGITDETGLMSYIKNVSMADLLGDSAGDAILNAIIGNETDGYTTLGDFLDNTENSGIMSMINSVTMRDLLGKNPDTTAGEALMNALGSSGQTLGDLLGIDSATGITKIVADISLSDLFGGSVKPTEAISGIINQIKLVDVFPDVATYDDNNILKILYDMDNDILITEIGNSIDTVKLSAVIGTNKPAIFNLVSNYEDLTLSTIDDIQIVENITIGNLIDAGVIDERQLTNLTDTVKNTSLKEVIQAYIDALEEIS